MDRNGAEVHAVPAVGVAQVGRSRPLEAPAAWVGAVARVELTVTDADTAQAVGSGDVPVLATPRVVALVEAASVAATTTRLPPGTTTVGTRVDLDHRAATAVGRTVVAEARVAKTEGRRLAFEVVVREGDEVVAEGRLERVLVDRHTFVARAFGAA
jgi:fluoroacetyl-CoA thioesterase